MAEEEHVHNWVISGWSHDIYGGQKYRLIQWRCETKTPECPHWDKRMRLNGYAWTRAIQPIVPEGVTKVSA